MNHGREEEREHRMDTESGAKSAAERTLADFLEGYIGVLDSSEFAPGGSNLSEETGRQFAEGLMEQREQGRL